MITQSPVTSQALATVDLTSLDVLEASGLISREAITLLGAPRAAVWIYSAALQQLAMPAVPEPKLVGLDAQAADTLLSEPKVWSYNSVGTRRTLIEESFGPASAEGFTVLAVPLRAGVGLMLLQFASSAEASEVLVRAGDLAAQAASVLRNLEAFASARRHEHELQALYATAGELTRKLSVNTVLQAIADRASQLLGTEAAYITLIDEEKEQIYMRVTSGIRRPTFGDIRLDLGMGLGGVVARDQRPIYTSDYLNDASITHDPAVDAEVRAEGIKSILGVPMRVGSQVIGVLYVANRSVTSFGDADVYLLSSLADHAAVALENARLYEKATEAVDRLNQAHQLIRQQYDQLERTEAVHDELTQLVLEGKDLEAIVGVVADLIGQEIVILDEAGEVWARSTADEGHGAGPAVDEFLHRVDETRGTVWGDGYLITPIVAGSDTLGYLVSELASSEKVDETRPILEQAARVVALDLLREKSVREAEERLRGSFVDDLLSNRPPPDPVLIERGREMGVNLTRSHYLAVLKPLGDNGVSSPEARGMIQRLMPDGFMVPHAGELVVIAPATERTDERGLVEALDRALEGRDVLGVVAGACRVPSDYHQAFAEARRGLEFLEKLGNKSRIAKLEDLRLLSLLFSGARREDVAAFIERAIGPLIEYDNAHRTELGKTAETYLSTLGHLARTAEACHVHVNTVHYRLGRIRKIMGEDWDGGQRLPDLQVAFLARRIL